MTASPPHRPYDELLARYSEAALVVSGADRSNWNGRYREVNERGLGGRAQWDGTLELSDEHVIKPLQDMYEKAGQRQDIGTLDNYRTAVKIVLHENGHFMSARGTTHRQGEPQFKRQRATRALEEGVTERWARRNLDRYIEQLGLEQIAPGIGGARERPAYPKYTPAVDALVDGISQQSGLSSDEVLRRMNNVHAGQKWEVAAGMMCQANGLAAVVPREKRAEVTRNVARAMREGFEQNHPDRLPDNAGYSQLAHAGASALASAQREVDMYRAMYGGGELLPGRHQAQPPGRGQDQPNQDRPRGGGQLNDLDHAMALHNSAAPPLAGATRLDANQFGSRRETGTHTQQRQRQGPERSG